MKKCKFCRQKNTTLSKYCSNTCLNKALNKVSKELQIAELEHKAYMQELWLEALKPKDSWIIKIDDKNSMVKEF